jgi:hypothetical protein
MITFFYTFIIVFIWNEIYYIKNKHRLSLNFKNKDIESTTVFDIFYYFTRLLYWIWLIVGIFTSLSPYFIILFSLVIIKLITFKSRKKSLYVIFDNIFPILSVFLLGVILLIKFTS